LTEMWICKLIVPDECVKDNAGLQQTNGFRVAVEDGVDNAESNSAAWHSHS
jgi:hypothetical protein